MTTIDEDSDTKEAQRRQEALVNTLLRTYGNDAGATMRAVAGELGSHEVKARIALAARMNGGSWSDAARIAELPTPEAARKAAKRAAADWSLEDSEMNRALLVLRCESTMQLALEDYRRTGSVALLRVVEKLIGRQQSLLPGLAVQQREVVVRPGREPDSEHARPEYGGNGRTWVDMVRDGLDQELHPDDVRRLRLTPQVCAELRQKWAQQDTLERARLIEA